jgi:hypothetical protein
MLSRRGFFAALASVAVARAVPAGTSVGAIPGAFRTLTDADRAAVAQAWAETAYTASRIRTRHMGACCRILAEPFGVV